MWKYILRRIFLMIPVLLAISFVIFSLMTLSPGDPGSAILGASAEPEAIQAFNESVGYYDPFFVRYGNYLKNLIFKFDLGISWATKNSLAAEIANRFPITFQIAVYSMVVAIIVGIPLGVLSAVKQYSMLDHICRVMAIALASVPFFWLGLMMIYWFSLKLHLLPAFGATSFACYVLPCVALGLHYAGRELRMTRSCMLENLRQDFIRTARAKGVKEERVILHHALRNSLLPILTTIGSHFGMLLGGAIVTESLFSMPGIGYYLLTSIRSKDTPATMAVAMVMALSFSVVMLVVDILYAQIDPRIKARFSK
ncbi:MAG: ABC transporter permease [Clostridiales bacterium]|nr:ABC transporter permease [Clostridiales bacterium]